jgi:hypothetical protein
MDAERELTKMQLNDLRQELFEAQKHQRHPTGSQPRQEDEEEEQRPHRVHPKHRTTFSDRLQQMDFTQATNLGRANNLCMLPHNKFNIDNL